VSVAGKTLELGEVSSWRFIDRSVRVLLYSVALYKLDGETSQRTSFLSAWTLCQFDVRMGGFKETFCARPFIGTRVDTLRCPTGFVSKHLIDHRSCGKDINDCRIETLLGQQSSQLHDHVDFDTRSKRHLSDSEGAANVHPYISKYLSENLGSTIGHQVLFGE